jgi:phosphoribosylglycinamide formyltransferase-1
MVEEYHIPLICFSYQRFKSEKGITGTGQEEASLPWRLEYDREIMKRLRGFHPDLCVLAGYMLIVGKEMCQRYNMINLHPAAPGGPAGTWQEVIWQLIESRAEETGVMMHLVTPDLDKGPPVTYCTFPIRGKPFDKYWEKIKGFSVEEIRRRQGEDNPLFKLIRQHGLAREFPLLISTLKTFSQGKIRITKEKQVVDAEGKPVNGYNLTDKIDRLVKRGD